MRELEDKLKYSAIRMLKKFSTLPGSKSIIYETEDLKLNFCMNRNGRLCLVYSYTMSDERSNGSSVLVINTKDGLAEVGEINFVSMRKNENMYMSTVEVKPNYRDQGYGSLLLEKSISYLIQNGCKSITINSLIDLKYNAKSRKTEDKNYNFYSKNGFEVDKRVLNIYTDGMRQVAIPMIFIKNEQLTPNYKQQKTKIYHATKNQYINDTTNKTLREINYKVNSYIHSLRVGELENGL